MYEFLFEKLEVGLFWLVGNGPCDDFDYSQSVQVFDAIKDFEDFVLSLLIVDFHYLLESFEFASHFWAYIKLI